MDGACLPESAGGLFFVPLADVRNSWCAEVRQLSALRPSLVQRCSVLGVCGDVSAGPIRCCWLHVFAVQAPGDLLSHTSVPVPEAQRKSLPTSGSCTGLFDESLLSDVVAKVQRSSLISSNLAVSRSFGRARSRTSSSSPLMDPSSGAPRAGRSFGKRSAPSSQSGGGKLFRGGKGSAPSSKPSGFRK